MPISNGCYAGAAEDKNVQVGQLALVEEKRHVEGAGEDVLQRTDSFPFFKSAQRPPKQV